MLKSKSKKTQDTVRNMGRSMIQMRVMQFIGAALLLVLIFNGKQKGNEDASEDSIYNRLVDEKSPYLLQHAENPVDWFPWGDEAFEKAKRENKPIFLSIGYSSCHWCHVMEDESFDDEEVALLMNETFVSIIVDREERPDIDSIYMTVSRIMTGRGGWPLTIVMTPDKKPFYAATYIPKYSRPGLLGMMELIPRIKETWETKREEIETSADYVTEVLEQVENQNLHGDAPGEEQLEMAFQQLHETYDPVYGGFNISPKFPSSNNLIFLLRYWRRSGNHDALRMTENTLRAMRRGGVYDHVGFGFHRYSTDREWVLPHFEKMLYDQALLALAYLEAYRATGKPEYAQTVREIFSYIIRDMTSPQGGFYSAEDADSEGEEGKFYLWKAEEMSGVLGSSAPLLMDLLEELEILWEKGRRQLFRVREDRVHPLKDDKILTDWNGLMITAFARGGRMLDVPEYVEKARGAADFILLNMRTSDGRLLHRYRENEVAFQATLNDYAYLVRGLIELYQSTFRPLYLKDAVDLTSHMFEHFWDDKNGGFFTTPDDGEKLIIRQKQSFDGALPSGNAVAMLALVQLSRLTGDPLYEERAIQIGKTFSQSVSQYPSAHINMMAAVDFLVGPAYEIVVVGNPEAEDTQNMIQKLESVYLPNKVVLLKPEDKDSRDLIAIAPYIEHFTSIDGRATVYVCQNFVCDLPTTNVDQMMEMLTGERYGPEVRLGPK
jgi:uncharacterized protein YyaL (SSP411 family)